MDVTSLNFTPEIIFAFGICFVLIVILYLKLFSVRKKLSKLINKYNNFMGGLGEKNIEQLLETCLDRVNQVGIKNREIETEINSIERNLIQCIQKIGIIRYNAFDNVGSNLSFSIAMLDNNNDGFVISGIYSRDSSSTYAKPVIAGKSKYTLSAEEIQALDIAIKNSREKLYFEK